jgi:Tfp pilus assembly ATPase PilU
VLDYIARGRNDRMQTFDQHLLDLLKANKISGETAHGAASNPADFQTRLALEGHGPEDDEEVGKPMAPMDIESDGRF